MPDPTLTPQPRPTPTPAQTPQRTPAAPAAKPQAPQAPRPSPAAQQPPALPQVKKGARKKVADMALNSKTVQKYGAGNQRMADMAKPNWSRIADFHGLLFESLAAFNPEIAMSPVLEAQPDQTPYLPSAQEVLLWQTLSQSNGAVTAAMVRDTPSAAAAMAPEGMQRFRTLESSGRMKVVAAARDRQAGETGDAYAQVSEAFYTPNAGLAAGAASSVDGKVERKAAWGAAWKCNVFVNDTMAQAGLKTPMLENKHYATAGMMYQNHTDKAGEKAKPGTTFEEVGYGGCQPGDVFVRYGGTGEASSHTEVITHKQGDVFTATGAHDIGTWERKYCTTPAAYEQAVTELLRQHLKATGKEATASEIEGQRYSLGYQLAEAAHLRQMRVDDYRFLRHKQVGKMPA